MAILRPFRATAVVALLWGGAWAVSGVAIATWRVFLGNPQLVSPLSYWPRFALSGAAVLGMCGLAAGTVFALGLRKITGATSVDSVSIRSSVRWGAIAGAASTLVLPVLGLTSALPLLVAGAVTSGIGATAAMLTIGAARRAYRGVRHRSADWHLG